MEKQTSGILLVYKEQEYTSHDCISILRRILGIKRIGHIGTLDPMAKGVLPITVGTATRIMDYTDWDYKGYKSKISFGVATDTDDIWGQIIQSQQVYRHISVDEIKKVLSSFLGENMQLPPKYAAIKVKGKKLYEYAREGKEVEIKKRKVFFKDIDLVDVVYEGDILKEIEIQVSCSKGTYIRSLCRDIGESLGLLSTMSYLERTETGDFHKEAAISIEEIKKMDKEELLPRLIPTDKVIEGFRKVTLDIKQAKDFVNGKKLSLRKINDTLKLDEPWLSAYLNESFNKNENVNNLNEQFKQNDEIEQAKEFCLPKFKGDKDLEDCHSITEFSKKLGYKKNYFRVYFGEEFLGVGRLSKGSFLADKVFNVRIQNENI